MKKLTLMFRFEFVASKMCVMVQNKSWSGWKLNVIIH